MGSGIVIYENNQLSTQMTYKLADECSNNQAEQLAVVKVLENLRKDFRHLEGPLSTAAIHTDSNIILDAIANHRNHQHLIQIIRGEVSYLEKDNWTIHLTWVKAHNDSTGNEMADRLAKQAARRRDGETAFSKIPKKCRDKSDAGKR
jgi:ribonuclease HI